jgi:AraC-like DNA-binding protein
MARADDGYAPLVAMIERRLAGVPSSEPARAGLASKRRLLELGVDRFGDGFIESLATEVAAQTHHPLIRALCAARGPHELMRRWDRFATTTHTRNRAQPLEVGARSVCLLRTREGGGLPSELEDRFVVALLGGLIARAGGSEIATTHEETSARGRVWALEWTTWRVRPLPLEPFGITDELCREVLTRLLADGPRRLGWLARDLGMSPRTLQRHLGARRTSLRALGRLARIVRAGELLVHGSGHRSLTEVAASAGFADSAHFTREFRAHVGMTPSAFARHLA